MSGPGSLLLACGTSGWGSSDVSAGLKKETLLVNLPTPSADACPFLFGESVFPIIPHCWFMASNLFLFIVSLVSLRVALLAHSTDISLLEAFLFEDLFFLILLLFLDFGDDDEPESWEDEVKLNMDMAPGWAERFPGLAGPAPLVDLLLAEETSEDFSTRQRTLRLRGLNQILKFFFCLKTEGSFSALVSSRSEKKTKQTKKKPKWISSLTV